MENFNEVMDAVLLIGRFQGITKKHHSLITLLEQMSGGFDAPIIGIITGKKTSEDMFRNPFTFLERVQMIRKINSHIICIEFPTAFIGDILAICYGQRIKPTTIITGKDRVEAYEKMLRNPKYFEPFEYWNIDLQVLKRLEKWSGTKFRDALLNNDKELFEEQAPIVLHGEFKNLRKIYLERLEGMKNCSTCRKVAASWKPPCLVSNERWGKPCNIWIPNDEWIPILERIGR